MNLRSTFLKRRLIVLVALVNLWLAVSICPKLVGAASTQKPFVQVNAPALQITHVDTTRFPQVDVYVHGENLGGALDSIPLTILEDGRTQEIINNDFAPVGVQVALMTAVVRRDNQDETSLTVGEAARRLTNLGLLSPTTDWLSALAAVDGSNIGVLQGWNVQHAQTIEAIARHRPPEGGPQLALYDMLDMALNRFEQPEAPTNLKRMLVLFSHGIDRRSARTLTDVTNRANSKGVTIHAVLAGQVSGPGRANLQRLAANTGGQFIVMNNVADLDSLWQTLAGARNQRILTYRSGQKRAWQVTAVAMLPNGAGVQAERRFPAPPLKPVQVTLPQIVNNTVVAEKESGPFAAAPTDVLTIPLQFVWPDGYERTIAQVEYTIDNNTAQAQKTPPFSPLPIPLSLLDTGNHTLRIRATDELGIAGESNPVLLQIKPVYALASPDMLMLIGGGLLVGLVAAAGGGVWWYRAKIEKAKEDAKPRFTGALLIEMSPQRGTQYKIFSGNNNIGRSEKSCKIKVSEEYSWVSNRHCRIRYAGGHFILTDTKSSGGTFINEQELPPGQEHILSNNDVIRLGRGRTKQVEYRFQLDRDTERAFRLGLTD